MQSILQLLSKYFIFPIKTYVSALRSATGAKTPDEATRDAPIALVGALNAVNADAVAAMERTARENFMVTMLWEECATSLVVKL